MISFSIEVDCGGEQSRHSQELQKLLATSPTSSSEHPADGTPTDVLRARWVPSKGLRRGKERYSCQYQPDRSGALPSMPIPRHASSLADCPVQSLHRSSRTITHQAQSESLYQEVPRRPILHYCFTPSLSIWTLVCERLHRLGSGPATSWHGRTRLGKG